MQEGLKEFKKDEGVFKHLGSEYRSIVKSKNPKIFALGSHPYWIDCLSGALIYSEKNDCFPELTFAISIKDNMKMKSKLLYFLSFIQIENLFQDFLNSFIEGLQYKMNDQNKNIILQVLRNGNN